MSGLVESGVDYCRSHHGIRNEDEERCDFVSRDPWDPTLNCSVCGGVGDDCDHCDEEGVTLCDLTPLLYDPAPPSEPVETEVGG